jgi:type 1 fimbria pilin
MALTRFLFLAACAAAACHAREASAACTVTYTPPFMVNRSGGIVVDGDLPVGALVRATSADSATASINCSAQTTTVVSMELQGDGLFDGTLREITVGGQRSGLGIRLLAKVPGDTGYTALPRKVTRPFAAGASTWQTFFYAEYVRTGGPVKYGPADTAVNARLGRIWVPDMTAFAPNRIIHPVTMVNLLLLRPACSIETGSLSQDVPLGNYAASDLRNGKVVPAWQAFKLTMAACADPANLLTDITFGTAADADAGHADLFSMNAQGPGGYGIAIETGDGAARMRPGIPHGFAAIGTGASYAFRARLERSAGNITAGRIQRPIAVRVTFR